jgi:hypothetical protein
MYCENLTIDLAHSRFIVINARGATSP